MVDARGQGERDEPVATDDPLARLERLVNARTQRMGGSPAPPPAYEPEPETPSSSSASGTLRGAIDDLYGAAERTPAMNAAAHRLPEMPVLGERVMDDGQAPLPADPFNTIAELDDALARALSSTTPRALPDEPVGEQPLAPEPLDLGPIDLGPLDLPPPEPEPLDLPPLDIEAELALDPVHDTHHDPVPPQDSFEDLPPSLAALRGDWPAVAPTLSEALPERLPEPLPPLLGQTDPLPRFLCHADTAADEPVAGADDIDAQFDAALDAEMGAGLNDAVSGALAAATAALAATATQRPNDRPAAIEPLAVPAPPAYVAGDEPAAAPPIEFGDDFERELVDELLQIEPAPGAPAPMPEDPLVAPGAMAASGPDEDERPEPANDNGGRRRGAMVAAMLAGVAVVGGLAAFSLGGGTEAPTEVALIRAEAAPARVRPAEPGGRTVPNQSNAVYERVAKVETAQAKATAPAAPPAIVDKTEDVSTIREPLVPATGETVARLDAVDVSPRDVYAPRAVRTIQVGPDGTLVTNEPAAEPEPAATAVASLPATPAGPAEPVETGTLEGTPAPGTPLPRFRPADLRTATLAPSRPAVNSAAAQIASAAPVSQPTFQPVSSGGYVVQIASVPSADAARRTYGELAARFGSVIGGRGVDYQVADIAGKGTFHRVRIPAQSKADASATCAALQSAGGSCFVTR